jgi:hypothetical protein
MKRFYTSSFMLIILIGICLLFPTGSSAQTSNAELIPKLTPATPEVAALGKFGSYPVGYFTGSANISIPLYDVTMGDISVPVSINYHSAGIKVAERASWAGLGWSLSAGGNISRKVMGPKADEQAEGYLTGNTLPQGTLSPWNETDLVYIRDVNYGWKDTEPDIFSYSFAGFSGQFFFNQRQNYRTVFIPYSPLTVIRAGSPNLLFDVTDPSGVNYKFTDYEEHMGETSNTRTAWLMSNIISVDKQDTLKFSYTTRAGFVSQDLSESQTVNDFVSDNCISGGGFASGVDVVNSQVKTMMATEKKISQIVFPLGKVVFTPSTADREDGFSGQKRLEKIDVYTWDPLTNSYSVLPLKTIKFFHSYFISTDPGNAKRLRLDSLQIIDGNNTLIQRYKFDYETNTLLPDYLSRSRDYWGYYNHAPNSSLIPRTQIVFQSSESSPTANIWIGSDALAGREPDSLYMQACILKKIHYPTGGLTEFVYETNRYKDGANQKKYAGGLRIRQIKSYESTSSQPLLKTFRYGVNQSGYGRPNFLLVNYFFEQTVNYRQPCPSDGCTSYMNKRVRTYVSTPSIEIEPYDGSPVVYPEVTEYEGDELNNNGKTIYTFSDFQDLLTSTTAIGNPVINSFHYKRGLLTNKTVYKNNGSGSFVKVHETINTYGAFYDSLKTSVGFKAKKILVTLVNGTDTPFGAGDICASDANSYVYNSYSVQTGDNRLISTNEMQYDQNNVARSISLTSTHSYENYLHQQITKTTTTNSRGETIENTIKYPHESSGSVYTGMVQKNLWAYPVEEVTKVNNIQKQKITRNYSDFSTYVVQPLTIYRQFLLTSPNDLEVTFTGYDLRGNILSYMGRDGIPHAFTWGYKGQVPIAETVNASHTKVLYAGFEETLTNTSTTFTKTGARAWYNVAYAVSIPSVGNFNLTYWKKVGGNAWEYVVTTISASTSIGGANTYIDEVRLHPVGSTMSTYTYKPGIGISSSNDPNSRSSFYDFDFIGRLKTIKDHDGNILKSHDYNYTNKTRTQSSYNQ